MRERGIDYFENTRRAAYAQRAYAIANPKGWFEYGANVWGFTACDGPGTMHLTDRTGRARYFLDYSARGVGRAHTLDDGTIAPTAAVSSIAVRARDRDPGRPRRCTRATAQYIYRRYGFLDAFNRSFTATDVTLSDGRVDPAFGWVATDYLGIDQGPILAMIGNYRNELVWDDMRKCAPLRRGLARAGFTGGWLDQEA